MYVLNKNIDCQDNYDATLKQFWWLHLSRNRGDWVESHKLLIWPFHLLLLEILGIEQQIKLMLVLTQNEDTELHTWELTTTSYLKVVKILNI